MRVAWLSVALALSLPLAAPMGAYAMAPAADGRAASPQSRMIEPVVHCGSHAHYVHGHRNREGHYVKGRCVRNHHEHH